MPMYAYGAGVMSIDQKRFSWPKAKFKFSVLYILTHVKFEAIALGIGNAKHDNI